MQTFPPHARLRQSAEFKNAFKSGRRFIRRGWVVIATPSQASKPRLGLAIAKKRLAKAVDRNRVKRITRESFRCHRTQLPPVDIVVLARHNTQSMTNKQLNRQLQSIWQEIINWQQPT